MSVSKRSLKFVAWIGILILGLVALACNGGGGSGSSSSSVSLQGAGASFPNPLYQKWLSEYGHAKPNIKIDYQSIGSGGGIKQLKEQTVDFGASDAPMKDEDMKSAPGEIVHIPTVLGAVVITYNLTGIAQPLRFSPEVIADIFLGKIKKWNDPKIAADNTGVTLPASDITVVHRSDSSGTSAVFTDYLSKVSPEWKEKVGAGVSPSWRHAQHAANPVQRLIHHAIFIDTKIEHMHSGLVRFLSCGKNRFDAVLNIKIRLALFSVPQYVDLGRIHYQFAVEIEDMPVRITFTENRNETKDESLHPVSFAIG